MSQSPNATPATRDQQIAMIQAHLGAGRIADALQLLAPMTKPNSKDATAWALRAMLAEQMNQPLDMEASARRSLSLQPSAHAFTALATALGMLGRTDEALANCDQARKMVDDPGPIDFLQGKLLEEAGQYAEAEAVMGPTRSTMQKNNDAMLLAAHYEWSKLLMHRKEFGKAIHVIDSDILPHAKEDERRAQALYLRAKICDRAGQYEDAWESATKANQIGRLRYNPDGHAAQVDAVMQRWSPALIDRFPVSNCMTDVPVFITGMPRSGTSLAEQIIHAHPQAAGVGELDSLQHFARKLGQAYDASKPPPECFGPFQEEALTRTANHYVAQITAMSPANVKRIANKALGTERLVGLLSRLFPSTRIIHTVRDPRDEAVSCYLAGFNNRTYGWTTEIEWIAHAQRQSARMMAFWSELLDIPMLELSYDTLIRQPDVEMPRLIEFLDLEWHPDCRAFHTSARTVRTLSYDQVNQPLYDTSVGRWRNYEQHLSGIEWDQPTA